MDKIKFIPLTYISGAKTYTKVDAIVQLLEDEDKTYVYTINDERPMMVKESMDNIVRWIEANYKEKSCDVLDKIIAEIEQSYCTVNNDYARGRNYGLYMATQIIDKYKTESEDKK